MSPTQPFSSFGRFHEAWAAKGPGEQVRQLRQAAEAAREELLADGPVDGLETCSLVTFPYPALFAFCGGALSPAPYVMMTNRMHVVQWDEAGVRRTLLFNPSDYERGKRAPFYAKLRARYGELLANKVFATYHGTVQGHLERLGLRPEDVDYIAYDHLHVQDLRGWLGGDGPAFFPRAKLIVDRREWASVQDLHPMNAVWYVPDGMRGVPEDRLVLIDGSVKLGRGVALVDTRGHTLGNMSLAVVTPRGLYVISENGVAPESYTPEHSRIPGVRAFARQMGWEVVLNGNTREGSLDQYASMLVEKTLAGPSADDPSFVNFYPSSHLATSVLAPGLSPTFVHPELSSGLVTRTLRPPVV